MIFDEKEKNMFKGFLAFFLYFLMSFFKYLPFQLMKVNINNIPDYIKYTYVILLELVVILIIYIMFRDTLIDMFNDFKKSKNYYFKKYFKYWFVILISTGILNILISFVNNSNISGNETVVRTMLTLHPIYVWVSGVILAPILEELIFRFSIRTVFSYKWIFIIVSGLLFGGTHLLGTVTSTVDLLYLLPYAIPGCIFAYIYYDSDNIFNTMGLHFIHNGILMSLQILFLIFGFNIV